SSVSSPSSSPARIASASASVGSPRPRQSSGSVVASRIPAIGPSTTSAFAPCSSAARAEGRSGTWTMTAIPSPWEMWWLRRREDGTRCEAYRLDVHEQAVVRRLPAVGGGEAQQVVVRQVLHLLDVAEDRARRAERAGLLERRSVARLVHGRPAELLRDAPLA